MTHTKPYLKLLSYFSTVCFLALASYVYSEDIRANSSSTSNEKPNILLIMVDDMGFSDIGSYGGEIPTPNIDALALNGVRMTNFHNTARCCPSRASLVTGLYPQRAGAGHMLGSSPYPGYQSGLKNPIRPSLRSPMLQAMPRGSVVSGISVCTGRKHPDVIWQDTVRDAGFRWYDTISPSGTSYFYPFDRSGSERAGDVPTDEERRISDATYVTEWYADGVINYLNRSEASSEPHMIYWAPTAPHYPLQCLQKDLDQTRGWYDAGPEQIALTRYQRLVELGIIDSQWPYTLPEIIRQPDVTFRTDVRTDTDQWPPDPNYTFYNKKNQIMGCSRSCQL